VWLLEPEVTLSALMVDALDAEGFRVTACRSAPELTQACLSEQGGIIVVDLDEVVFALGGRGAGEDGWLEAFARVRPLVVLTSIERPSLPASCTVVLGGMQDFEAALDAVLQVAQLGVTPQAAPAYL
jgi:hypothetical protein